MSDLSDAGRPRERRPIQSAVDPRQDTTDHHMIELDVSNLSNEDRNKLADTLREVGEQDSFVRSYIAIDSAKLSFEQRQALTSKLRSVARGVALTGGLGLRLGAEGGHVSHNDSDGWF